MANSYLDNCGFAPTAGSTTDWTYSAGVAGYQSPANANAVNGSTYVVRAQSADLTQWEYAAGAYNSGTNTFPRTTVLYNSSGTGTKQSGAGTKINFTNPPSLVAVVHLAEDISRNYTQKPCGRLTATPATPVTTADVTAVSTIYYTPNAGDGGNIITLWDGAIWIPITFPETSLSLAGLAANTNYDVWGRINAGALAIDVTAWTNDTTRATAITQQDGIDVKSGDVARRLLGTIRTTGTIGQTEDSLVKRYISNRYNAEIRPMQVNDPTASWTYSAASFRQVNGNAANQLDYVCCVARLVQVIASGQPTSTVTCNCITGIGIDGIASNSAQISQSPTVPASGQSVNLLAYYAGTPGIGRHTLAWMEYAAGSGTQTWLGTTSPWVKMGIVGAVNN